MIDDPSLTSAYALSGKDAVRDLYENWAETYDASFAEAQGYLMPAKIAEALVKAGGTGPVLDVGAGTGIGGVFLAGAGIAQIDGIDLSEDMLGVARAKGVYRDLITADITADITTRLGAMGPYNSIVSAGTFTFGHVGPDGLPALLEVAAGGCVFALGVNAAHFVEAGFAAAFDAMGGRIEGLAMRDTRIYDDRADAGHRMDLARIVTFTKR